MEKSAGAQGASGNSLCFLLNRVMNLKTALEYKVYFKKSCEWNPRVWPFESAFPLLHKALESRLVLHTSGACPFVLLNSFPLLGCNTVYLSTYQQMDFGIVSGLGLL